MYWGETFKLQSGGALPSREGSLVNAKRLSSDRTGIGMLGLSSCMGE